MLYFSKNGKALVKNDPDTCTYVIYHRLDNMQMERVTECQEKLEAIKACEKAASDLAAQQ